MSYVIGFGRRARETYPEPNGAASKALAVLANHKEYVSGPSDPFSTLLFDAPSLSFTTITGKVRVTAGMSPSTRIGGNSVAGDPVIFNLRVDGSSIGPTAGLGGVPSTRDGAHAMGSFVIAQGTMTAELVFAPGSSHTFGIQAFNVNGHTMAFDTGEAYVDIQDIG